MAIQWACTGWLEPEELRELPFEANGVEARGARQTLMVLFGGGARQRREIR
jgi:hypothetical protein